MARQRKDGSRLNVILEQPLRDRLERCSERERRTITATVEIAISEYLDKYDREQEKKSSK